MEDDWRMNEEIMDLEGSKRVSNLV